MGKLIKHNMNMITYVFCFISLIFLCVAIDKYYNFKKDPFSFSFNSEMVLFEYLMRGLLLFAMLLVFYDLKERDIICKYIQLGHKRYSILLSFELAMVFILLLFNVIVSISSWFEISVIEQRDIWIVFSDMRGFLHKSKFEMVAFEILMNILIDLRSSALVVFVFEIMNKKRSKFFYLGILTGVLIGLVWLSDYDVNLMTDTTIYEVIINIVVFIVFTILTMLFAKHEDFA